MKEFMTHLKMWELMYPYKVFASPKYIVHKKECSICGRDWRDAKCMHIPGRIYGGELMNYKVKENEMLEISVVENPEDKKLLIKPETGYEPGFFRDLDAIQRYNNKPLQKLEVYGEFREGAATKSLVLNGQRMYLYDMTLIGFRQLHVQWYAESIDLRPQI
ncbi:MAG: hypothetical protein E7Z62_08085 [Thermoplasmata archaeon]|nr:hypothetical protein [Thermoplasmata archaeon]